MPDTTTPLMSSFLEIDPAWIDYNNHLNMGYYSVIFDRTADDTFHWIGFGPDYIARSNHTTFVAGFHVRYLRELKLGDRVRASLRILAHDAKRIHTFQELFHEDGWLAATGEGMTLHIDLSGPRVAPMPEDIHARVTELANHDAGKPFPEGAGERIGFDRP